MLAGLRTGSRTGISGVRFASNKTKPVNRARKMIPTKFPTEFNPIRSASNPRIQRPKGLVYDPAPAAPSPYETPAAFLPPEDTRQFRKDDTPYDDIDYMPKLKQLAEKKYNLTEEDMIEIQKLRNSDPEKWTKKALAEKFNCSPFFISIASAPNAERQKEMDRRLKVIKSLWTESRYRSRRDRERRRQLWLRDSQ